MDYKCIERIEDVLSYKVFEDKLLYVLKESKALYLNNVLIDNNVGYGSYTYKCGKVLYSKDKQSIYSNNGLITEKSLLEQNDFPDTEGLVVMGDYKLENYAITGNYEYLNIKSGEIAPIGRLHNITYIYLECNQVFFASKSEVRSFDLEKGKEVWSYSLSTLGNYLNVSNEEKQYAVKTFLGSYNGLLIIQLANATILFLDIVSGEVSKVLHVNTLCPLPQGVFYDDAFAPHIIDGQLIWLNNQRLLEINLEDYKIKVVKNYYDESKEKQFRFMHNSYFGDKIYFVADYGWQYVTPSRIGEMDGATGEVIWNKQLEKTGGLPESPKVTANNIFIRTAKGDLYVFDKSS